MSPRRPLLRPALHRVWRDASTLQLGIDPGHAVLLAGLDPAAAQLVESLDGTRDRAGVLATAVGLGMDADTADELLVLLDRSGVLDDAADRWQVAGLSRVEQERLAPDLASLSVSRGGRSGGVDVIARRRQSCVAIRGAGRVGASLAALLAAAGVGALLVEDRSRVTPADTAPAGPGAADVGGLRHQAAVRAAKRVAPGVHTTLPRGRTQPDLVVVTALAAADSDLPDRLLRQGVAHLFATIRETTGVVGPLVVPGRSSCHHCHDLHRADRDPAWPSIAAQLSSLPERADSRPCDVVLATAVAAQAATQVLAFLDGEPAPPAVDGTIEISQADGRVRRRGWSRHPLCGCGWAGS